MVSQRVGRWILRGVATATIVNGYLADLNPTHLFNPRWPPHAKFHDATTILAGTFLGGTAFALLQRRTDADGLGMAAWLLPCFWLSLGGSVLFPQTAEVDPEFAHLVPRIAGVPIAQTAFSVLMLLATGAGYGLERTQLQGTQ